MSPRRHWQHNKQDQKNERPEGERIEIPLKVDHSFPHGQMGEGTPPWMRGQQEWQHNRQRTRQRHRMFLRWVGSLLFVVLLVGGAMSLASHLWSNVGSRDGPAPYFYFWRFCGFAIIVPLLFMFVGSRIFRSFAVPLADIMQAADEVATGNLQVRVQERGSRDFQRLATSFNRMTGELARVDQQRRNLTADVAHELRTPLHIIQGNLEGLLDGVYTATPEHIEATLQETRTLARLVDDLRTLSLAESGELPLHPEIVDVHDLLADVATSFSPQAESAGITLSVKVDEGRAEGGTVGLNARADANVDAGAPLTLYGDPVRLDQVLSNLVNNALRHTPTNGAITLGAARVQNGPGQNGGGQNGAGDRIQLIISDTGEGIDPADLPYIFDRFWRGDRARTHQEGTGSGLGLAIAAQLVKAHGGSIAVASTRGQGTTFTLSLPISPHISAPASTSTSTAAAGGSDVVFL